MKQKTKASRSLAFVPVFKLSSVFDRGERCEEKEKGMDVVRKVWMSYEAGEDEWRPMACVPAFTLRSVSVVFDRRERRG